MEVTFAINGFSGCILGTVEKLPPILFKWQTVFVRLFCEINHTIFACLHLQYHPPITNLLLEETLVSPWFTIQRSEFFHAFSMVFHGFSMGFPWPNEVMSAMVGTLSWCLSPTSSWASLTTFPCRASRRSIGSLNGPSGSRPRCNGSHVGRAELNQHALAMCGFGIYIYNYYCIVIGSKL